MRGYDDIRPDTINASVECINPRLDFRNYGRLRFLPAAAGILATNAMNLVMRILSVCLVYACDLQIHLETSNETLIQVLWRCLEEHYIRSSCEEKIGGIS
jgi:hypothetical protein